MNFLRIVFFLLVLLLAQVAVGALVVIVVGPENLNTLVLVSYVASFIVATCVFSWMSWTIPGKPYAAAFVIGIGAGLLDAIATSLVVDDVIRDPVVFLFDVLALCVAVFVGINVGEKLRRK